MKKILINLFISGTLAVFIFWCSYQADAQKPPTQITDAIFQDIQTICKNYPYKVNSTWYEFQQYAWENQGFYTIPHIEELNNFCKQKGF